jgi:alpha-amylase/alpha-mannosidase (GH57 family)
MGRFQNNPSIGRVHPKSTHDVYPLPWGNKNMIMYGKNMSQGDQYHDYDINITKLIQNLFKLHYKTVGFFIGFVGKLHTKYEDF